MVVIHMKSTSDRDEWLYTREASVPTDELVKELVYLHNGRVRLRSQQMAAYYLLNEESNGKKHMEGKTEAEVEEMRRLHERARHVTHADRVAERKYATKEELDSIVGDLEAAAIKIFDECKSPGAVDELWKRREDGDTNEDDRLRAWYFLELIDPAFKERDFLDPAKAKLWWAGKEISRSEGTLLSSFTGRNEKSKIVCKLAGEATGCPAREPKMGYEQQRELREHFAEKKAAFSALEKSELADHKNVRRRASDYVSTRVPTSTGTSLFGDADRGQVDAAAAAAGTGLMKLNTNVRPIHHSGRVETDVPVE